MSHQLNGMESVATSVDRSLPQIILPLLGNNSQNNKKQSLVRYFKEERGNHLLNSIASPLKALNNNITEFKEKCNFGVVSKEELPEAVLNLSKLCNFNSHLFFKYMKAKEAKFTTTELLSLAQNYIRERTEMKHEAVNTRRGMSQFYEYFTETNNKLKRLFNNLADQSKTMTQNLKEFLIKSFDMALIKLATISGKMHNEIIDQLVNSISEYEGKIWNLKLHSLIEYIEVFILENDDIIFIVNKSPDKKVSKEDKKSIDEVIKEIRASINQNEYLLAQQVHQGVNAVATKNIILLLKRRLACLVNEAKCKKEQILSYAPSESNKTHLSDSKMLWKVKEIFCFYCKQQYMLEKQCTFDKIKQVTSYMLIGEFVTFCRDFKVPLKVAKLRELFKRQAKLGKELHFEDFLVFP